MKKLHKNLFMLLIIIVFFNIILYIYSDTIEDFAPQHIGIAIKTINPKIDLPTYESDFNSIPGFYVFLGELMLICNIPYNSIPTAPIMLLPYAFVFFGFVYVFTKRNIYLSVLLSFFTLNNGVKGTFKIFIWPHGMGEILYFTILLLICLAFSDKIKWQYNLLITISVLTLPFLSYNITFNLFLLFIMFLFIDNRYMIKSFFGSTINQQILIFAILLVIIELGLISFVYNSFIPKVIHIDILETSVEGFYKFFKYFTGQSISEEIIIKELLISVPAILTLIYVIKYIIILFITLLSLKVVYNKELHKGLYTQFTRRLFNSFLYTSILYSIARLFIGQFYITEIFYPFIAGVIILCKENGQRKVKKFLYTALLILIIINFSVTLISHQNKLVQKDEYSYIRLSADWTSRYIASSVNFPDQLTYGWFLVQFAHLNSSFSGLFLKNDDILALYTEDEVSSGKFIVVNYRLNMNSVRSWTALKSFSLFRDKIETNPSVQGIIYALNEDITIIIT